MEQEDTKDLQGEESATDQSTENDPTPPADGGLKNEGEEQESKEEQEEPVKPKITAEDLLHDGTPKDKDIRISKKKFDELNEKSKLYEASAPALALLQKDSDALKKLTKDEEGEELSPLEQRIAAIEESQKAEKRKVMTDAVNRAIETWPDFTDKWNEVKPIADSLEKQGLSYAEALQRAYFAINPDAAQENKKLLAEYQLRQHENNAGKVSGGASVSKRDFDATIELSPDDKQMAQSLGMSEDMYRKHWDYIKEKGLDRL